MRDLMFSAGMACAICGLVLAVWDTWEGRKKK